MRIGYEVLYTILDEESAARVCRALKGCTVSFPASKIERRDIVDDYRHMRRNGLAKWAAVERLSTMYERSKSGIWAIVKEADEADR